MCFFFKRYQRNIMYFYQIAEKSGILICFKDSRFQAVFYFVFMIAETVCFPKGRRQSLSR